MYEGVVSETLEGPDVVVRSGLRLESELVEVAKNVEREDRLSSCVCGWPKSGLPKLNRTIERKPGGAIGALAILNLGALDAGGMDDRHLGRRFGEGANLATVAQANHESQIAK